MSKGLALIAVVLAAGCAPAALRPIPREPVESTFIRPLFDDHGTDSDSNMRPVMRQISELVDQSNGAGVTKRVAVYYRDLGSVRSSAIHVDQEFAPASLLKVPLMLAYLKVAESQPEILTRRYDYDPAVAGDANKGAIYQPSHPLAKGTYTVDELLAVMVRYSDNNAKDILFNAIDKTVLHSVLDEFGIGLPTDAKIDFVTVQEYAAVFRQLYDSSYLRRDLSQKALKLLAETDFDVGLRTAVPREVRIAHKFGERHDDGLREIHDCGIVYHPRRPYLLCVLTSGTDVERQVALIGRIARLVNEKVDTLAERR